MSEQTNSDNENRQDLAEDRTDEAQDRTLLANERTFAGWCRTSLACVGVGLGFHAIFRKVEPAWVAKTIASAIILLGVFVIWRAYVRASDLRERKKGNGINLMQPESFKFTAIAISCASLALIAAIWFLI